MVNRKILKEQLEKEIQLIERDDDLFDVLCMEQKSISAYIEIWTYQQIEESLSSYREDGHRSLDYHLIQFDYIVYDECHYFSNDADFNTYTELSFDYLSNVFSRKVQIYLSATMKNISELIKRRKAMVVPSSVVPDYVTQVHQASFKVGTEKTEYVVDADYSHVHVRLFEDLIMLKQMIAKNIASKNQKWLIFTDNIERGKALKKSLCSGYQEKDLEEYQINANDVEFIDARYDKDEDAYDTVNHIVEKELSPKKVLIATSVIDNGVSIHDKELRNVVIMADTEESFIQMLGRKREDGHPLTIYIMKRDNAHFSGRLNQVNKILDFYWKHEKKVKKLYLTDLFFYCEKIFPIEETEYTTNVIPHMSFPLKEYSPLMLSLCGYVPNSMLQQELLKDALKNNLSSKVLYSYNGILAFNSFAVNRYRCLQKFYREMLDELKEDDFAFAIKQLSWLGKSADDYKMVDELFKDLDEYHKRKIVDEIESIIEVSLSKNQNKELKHKIRYDIEYFLGKKKKCPEIETLKRSVKRTDGTLSEEVFNKCMEVLEMDYIMEKPSGSEFLIRHKS